jgi:hypothetical protein
MLPLPVHMTVEGGYQIARIGAGFTEVIPGLQCAIFLDPDDSGSVVAHFRITPAEEEGHEPADA